MRPPIRTKSVGTKVSEAEYAALEGCARARGLKLAEWVRDMLLAAGRDEVASAGSVAGPCATDGVLLAELLALRALTANLLFSISQGERLTPQQMQALIERADAGKTAKAAKLLLGADGDG
jgi:hypothetical protein